MSDNYTFPAVFDYSEEGVINIAFCDFPEAVSCAETEDEAISCAQEVLALAIRDYEETNRTVPEPSVNVSIEENQKLVYINIWMPVFRSKIKEVYVKKTLTIPEWINILAIQNNVNFSSILVDGLKRELHLDDHV